MPEGPEVKLSADLIRPLVVNKYVGKIYIDGKSRYSDTSPEGYDEFNNSFRELNGNIYNVLPVKIFSVKTKGKFMYWNFDNDWYLLNSFGMSGQWSSIPGKHVCIYFRLYDDVGKLYYMYFNDPRHFGTIKFVNGRDKLVEKLTTLGWDPLQDQLSVHQKWLNDKIIKSNKPISQLLMDQSIFSGVGNYIKAEALYAAKLSPWRAGNSLSIKELQTLYQSIINIMQASYQHQGATIHTYKTVYGENGNYSSCFKVYDQKKDSLGNNIIKEKTPDGRTTHWCPALQK